MSIMDNKDKKRKRPTDKEKEEIMNKNSGTISKEAYWDLVDKHEGNLKDED